MKQKKSTLEEHTTKLKESEASYTQLVKEHKAIDDELENSRTTFTEFERRDIKIRENMKHGKTQVKKLRANIKKEEQKLEKFRENITEYENQLPKYEQQHAKLKLKLEREEKELETLLDGLKGKTQELRVEMEKKEQEVQPHQDEYNGITSQLETMLPDQSVYRKVITQINLYFALSRAFHLLAYWPLYQLPAQQPINIGGFFVIYICYSFCPFCPDFPFF